MSYLDFILLFLILPIGGLGFWFVHRARRQPPKSAGLKPVLASLIAISIIAVSYTIAWDNYLIATGVWWYGSDRVLGIFWGQVPIEEVAFFILQVWLTGLGVWIAIGRLPAGPTHSSRRFSRLMLAGLITVWTISGSVYILDLAAWRYLTLILLWAIPPIMLQVAFGGDILRQHGLKAVALIAGFTTYLAAADALAIQKGIWTIDPAQSLNIFLPGGLPLEEALFFLVTNILVVFSMVLWASPTTWSRLAGWVQSVIKIDRRLLGEPLS